MVYINPKIRGVRFNSSWVNSIFSSFFSDFSPKTFSTRIIILTGLFFCMIILFCFSGSLSSRLAIFHWTFPFKTLEEVLDSGYTIGAVGANANIFLFAPADSLRRKIADKNIEPYPPTKLGDAEAIKEELLKHFDKIFC